MLLAAVAALGWYAKQLDVVTAFLNAVLDNPQYAELPPGYQSTTNIAEGHNNVAAILALYVLSLIHI